jgi:tRNA A58 N-methylase Trm61
MEGGLFGSLVPTTNQVSDLLAALQAGDFIEIRVEEMLVRSWKPVPDRLRPADRMVAHTGYLVFARRLNARYRLWGADSRQKRRAVEFGGWPTDDPQGVD